MFLRYFLIVFLAGSGQLGFAETPKILPRDRDQVEEALPRRTRPVFTNGFELGTNEVVAFVGGTQTVKQGENGYLETLLIRYAGNKNIYFRNLGWQADTVYIQQRPRNFGTHLDQLNRIDATIIMAAFGQMEALDGVEKLPAFISAYEKLLDQFEEKTKQIILISPHLFEKPKSDLVPDLSARNSAIATYAQEIKRLAMSRNYLFVDLTGIDLKQKTINGIHLNDAGHWEVAFEIVSHLTGASPLSGDAVSASGQFTDPKIEAIRQLTIRKNFLWQQNWRPTNWAFAYGDRQHVPSSHDHRPGKPRWMPIEINSIIPMIEAAEEEIEQLNQ